MTDDQTDPTMTDCELCHADGGEVVLRTEELRVVLVDEPGYAGFARVIWNTHVREMTDLAPPQIARLMGAVFAVEDALRAVLKPLKVNLASLGNMTPHVHWHVIPRFADDAAFPDAIWAPARRVGTPRAVDWAAIETAVRRALEPLGA